MAAANTCVMMMFIWAAERFQTEAALLRMPQRRNQAH